MKYNITVVEKIAHYTTIEANSIIEAEEKIQDQMNGDDFDWTDGDTLEIEINATQHETGEISK